MYVGVMMDDAFFGFDIVMRKCGLKLLLINLK